MYANPAARTLLRLDDTKSPAGDSLLSYIAPAERDKIAERNRNREQGVPVPEEYETNRPANGWDRIFLPCGSVQH